MDKHTPLSREEQEAIFRAKLTGQTLVAIAAAMGCSVPCVRKWWRRARDHGVEGLGLQRRGRGASGLLSQFDSRVALGALQHKRRHPGWGAARVRLELSQDPALRGLRLPSANRLALLFKQQCPDCVKQYQHATPHPAPPPATAPHEWWQLDSQEALRLQNAERATICNIREPVGAAMIASQAFPVTTGRGWRKLQWTEVRAVLRGGFVEWGTMPDGLLTDNELGLAGTPTDPFPSRLTLWLAGLGIRHRCIRPGHPRDQSEVERTHRTLDGLALNAEALLDVTHLQTALDRERWVYNHEFPCRASDCAGRPPLVAHPELLQPRRPYCPEHELFLFDLQRVFDFLATFTFQRKVNAAGQVSLGRQVYYISTQHAGKPLRVRCLAQQHQWAFVDETGTELARRPLQGLSVPALTGLEPAAGPAGAHAIQLTLPWLVA